jgi:hypothetical protein
LSGSLSPAVARRWAREGKDGECVVVSWHISRVAVRGERHGDLLWPPWVANAAALHVSPCRGSTLIGSGKYLQRLFFFLVAINH